MWMLVDHDSSRAAKTAAFLRKQNVEVLVVGREEDLPSAEEVHVSIALFWEGWQPATVERVKRQYGVHALLCAPQIAADKYADVVTAGYADVVLYPPSIEFVKRWEKSTIGNGQTALEQLLEKQRKQTYTKVEGTVPFDRSLSASRRAEVWVLVGAKGGVGKTTIATLLATEFQQQKKRVVLAELDPMGNLAVLHQINSTVTSDRFETLPNYLSDSELEQNMMKSPLGYWIVPKGERPFGLSKDGISRLIHLVGQYADVLICDCHPAPYVSTVAAMQEADRVIAVTTSDRTGWSELPRLLKHTDKPVQLVLNRVREREKEADKIREFIQQEMGYTVLGVIHDDKSLYERVQQGLSVLGADKTQRTIRQIIGVSEQPKSRWLKR